MKEDGDNNDECDKNDIFHWLTYSLYENEYRIFKPIETTIRRRLW
jgi:hypothetical protein